MAGSPSHLFVYGTLRSGSDNGFARLLAKHGTLVGAACVSGRLFDFGRFPGARPTNQSDQFIIGEMFYLAEPEAILAELDEYEGPEFERTITEAELGNGISVRCWIYWYDGKSAGCLIASGDWFKR